MRKLLKNAFAFMGLLTMLFFVSSCINGFGTQDQKSVEKADSSSTGGAGIAGGGGGGNTGGGFESFPLPEGLPGVTVDIIVSDSISGTVVNGTKLKVFKAGTTTPAADSVYVVDGMARLSGLEQAHRYDFYLEGEKGKWAGSSVKNYLITEPKRQTMTMLQFKHGQITRGVTPPHIAKVTIDNAGGAVITDGYTIGDAEKKVYVEFTSDVGAVEDVAWNGFGAKLGIGAIPSDSSGIYGDYTADTDPTDGVFKSEYVFDIEKTLLPNGNTEFIIVGYDVANNRVEKHIPVVLNKTHVGASLANAKFTTNYIIMERVPFTNNTFSLDPDKDFVQLSGEHGLNPSALMPIGDRNSSYMTAVVFQVADKTTQAPVPIIGFDLYRKDKGSSDSFKFVSRTHYGEPKTETRFRWGVHQGFDTSSELEEGKEYEYKITVYAAMDSLESPVLTGKIMESFTYTLKEPENRKQVPIAQASNLSYSCKISNPKLLTKKEADWCDLGILILDGQGEGAFGSKFRYVFDGGDGNPDLQVDTIGIYSSVKRLSYKKQLKDLLASDFGITALDDLVKLDAVTGAITITEKFLNIPYFNVVRGTPMEYQAGVSYQWDIQDWGDSPYSLKDDRALRIVKMYGSNTSRSMGNNRSSGSNAVNGRFTLVITK